MQVSTGPRFKGIANGYLIFVQVSNGEESSAKLTVGSDGERETSQIAKISKTH